METIDSTIYANGIVKKIIPRNESSNIHCNNNRFSTSNYFTETLRKGWYPHAVELIRNRPSIMGILVSIH